MQKQRENEMEVGILLVFIRRILHYEGHAGIFVTTVGAPRHVVVTKNWVSSKKSYRDIYIYVHTHGNIVVPVLMVILYVVSLGIALVILLYKFEGTISIVGLRGLQKAGVSRNRGTLGTPLLS